MTSKNIFVEIVTYLLIFLFLYTGIMKLIDNLEFYYAMDKSHILYRFASILRWLIPIIELGIALCLFFSRLKRIGMYSSFILMTLFTIYVGYNAFFTTHEERPCTCGGIIEDMTWAQHFFFNMAFTILALLAIRFDKQKGRVQQEFTETESLSLS